MLQAIAQKREIPIDLCRRHGVIRLDLCGSAARGVDFDATTTEVAFLVQFEPRGDDLARFLDLKEALEALLELPVDLVEREAIEASRNYIRKRDILAGAEAVYAA